MEAFHIFRLACKPANRGRSSRLHAQQPHAHLPGAGIAFPHLQAPPLSRISEGNTRMASSVWTAARCLEPLLAWSDVANQWKDLVGVLCSHISSYDRAWAHHLTVGCLSGRFIPSQTGEESVKLPTVIASTRSFACGLASAPSFLGIFLPPSGRRLLLNSYHQPVLRRAISLLLAEHMLMR